MLERFVSETKDQRLETRKAFTRSTYKSFNPRPLKSLVTSLQWELKRVKKKANPTKNKSKLSKLMSRSSKRLRMMNQMKCKSKASHKKIRSTNQSSLSKGPGTMTTYSTTKNMTSISLTAIVTTMIPNLRWLTQKLMTTETKTIPMISHSDIFRWLEKHCINHCINMELNFLCIQSIWLLSYLYNRLVIIKLCVITIHTWTRKEQSRFLKQRMHRH
jgi:hypothetical protein